MRSNYVEALWRDPAATLDDLREAVTTLEDIARIARRVLGGAHPLTLGIERSLQKARNVLHARETPKFKREHGEARKKKAAEEAEECVS